MKNRVALTICLAGWISLGAHADVVVMTDGARFDAVAVESIALVDGEAILLARELREGIPVGEARALDRTRIRSIEFRAPGDTGVRPHGRAADMTMQGGNRFPGVWVESASTSATGLEFQVREARTPPGGSVFAVPASRMNALVFRPYLLSGPPPPTPTPPPTPVATAPSFPPSVSPPFGQPAPSAAQPDDPAGASRPVAAAAAFPSFDATTGRTDPAIATPDAPSIAAVLASVPATGPAPPPTPEPTPLRVLTPGDITRAMLRQSVIVEGEIAHYRPSWSTRAPNILTFVVEEEKTLDAVFWTSEDDPPREQTDALTRAGARIRVRGDVEDYRGNVQIRMRDARDLSAPSPPTTKAPETTPPQETSDGMPGRPDAEAPSGIADTALLDTTRTPEAAEDRIAKKTPSAVGESDLGKRVLLRGSVAELLPSQRDNLPTRVIVVDDDGGRIEVVFWRDPLGTGVGSSPPEVGEPWEVEGLVQSHRGALQLRARSRSEGP